jgi:hypothetical protein
METFQPSSIYLALSRSSVTILTTGTALVGAEPNIVILLKALTGQFAAMKVKLLAIPQVSKTGVSRELFRRELIKEILEKVFAVLSDYLETKQYEEVKGAIQRRVK